MGNPGFDALAAVELAPTEPELDVGQLAALEEGAQDGRRNDVGVPGGSGGVGIGENGIVFPYVAGEDADYLLGNVEGTRFVLDAVEGVIVFVVNLSRHWDRLQGC